MAPHIMLDIVVELLVPWCLSADVESSVSLHHTSGQPGEPPSSSSPSPLRKGISEDTQTAGHMKESHSGSTHSLRQLDVTWFGELGATPSTILLQDRERYLQELLLP